MSFASSTKGYNTSLIPLVDINGIKISTNELNFDGEYYQPLLLNVPSIKESMDVESRNFKTSTVNLEISNLPFSGQRFSDLLIDSSLINQNAVIWFKSQNSNTIDDCLKVFQGIVRGLSHTDEVFTIQLEDLTEKKSRKKLPERLTHSGDNYPNKYKNKPIPMVYGSVTRSPCIISGVSKYIDESDPEEIVEVEIVSNLTIDSREIFSIKSDPTFVGQTTFQNTGIFVGDEEGYIGVAVGQVSAYPTSSKATIHSDEGVLISSAILRKIAKVSGKSVAGTVKFGVSLSPSEIDVEYKEYISYGGDAHTGDSQVSDISEFPEQSISSLQDNNTYTGIILEGYSTNDSNSKHYLKLELSSLGSRFECDTYFIMKYRRLASQDGLLEDSVYEEGATTNPKSVTGQSPYYVWAGDNAPIAEEDAIVAGEETWTGFFDSLGNITNESDDAEEVTVRWKMNDYDNYSNGFNENDITSKVNEFTKIDEFTSINVGIVPSHDNLGLDADAVFAHKDEISEFHLFHIAKIDSLVSKKYYANVIGRKSIYTDNPEMPLGYPIHNPIDIIYDLVRSELGHDLINQEEYKKARDAHIDWQFAFTINKQIDSKKLIQEIAMSTKCYPAFKNDGTFTFNLIKNSYELDEFDFEINSNEVLSYSVNKSEPEGIYKRVDVQYELDYASNSYLLRTPTIITGENTGEVDDSGDDIWKDDYYGITDSKDAHLKFESKYIRQTATALKLTKYLSEYHKNDFLQFSLTLPLKYIDINVGDIIKFDSLLSNMKAYGIDYSQLSFVNGQIFYPLFIVTSTYKSLDSIKIECRQLHRLMEVGEEEIEEGLGLYPPMIEIGGTEYINGVNYIKLTQNITGDDMGWDGTDNDGNNYLEFTLPTALISDDAPLIEPYASNGAVVLWDTMPEGNSFGDQERYAGETLLLTDNVSTHQFTYIVTDSLGNTTAKPLIVEIFTVNLPSISINYSQHSSLSSVFPDSPNGQAFIIEAGGDLNQAGFSTNYNFYSADFQGEFTHVLNPISPELGNDYYSVFCGNQPAWNQLLFSAFDGDDGDISGDIIYGFEALSEVEPLITNLIESIGLPEALSDPKVSLDGIYYEHGDININFHPCIAGVVDSDGNLNFIRWNLFITDQPLTSLFTGDVNLDGIVNVLDIVAIVAHLLNTNQLEGEGLNRADLNYDGLINVLDVVQLVHRILEEE